MKLVMVTTSHAHWDGLAGNAAMFSEAVVQPAILNDLPNTPVDTIFIKKNPQTRRFEKAWKGKTSGFKRVNKQDKNYLSFTIEGLKAINCPESLRNKPVGCYILIENIEAGQGAPRRPLRPLPQLQPQVEEPKKEQRVEIEFRKQDIIEEALEAGVLSFRNGREQDATVEQPAPQIVAEKQAQIEVTVEEIERSAPAFSTNGIYHKEERTGDETSPAFFSMMMQTADPAEFERYCFLLLRLLGIHDIHRPANHAGPDAYGFFKFSTLSVVYSTTLVPGIVQENRMVTDHYLNLLKKEKIQFNTTSYTLKDSQKQVWILCRSASEQLLRTEDGIKLKLVSVEQLISLYQKRMQQESVNTDALWESIKSI
jgi:hypothetical protein